MEKQTNQNQNTEKPTENKTNTIPDKEQSKAVENAEGGQGGYSAEPEKQETQKEQEGMQQERKLGDVDVDKEQAKPQEADKPKQEPDKPKNTGNAGKAADVNSKTPKSNDFAADRNQNLSSSRSHTQRH